MSDYGDAVREVLGESEFVCTCSAMNSPTVRTIHVDINGNATCDNCGRGGDYHKFLRSKDDKHEAHA